MTERRPAVPDPDGEFQAYYRRLIVDSLQRSAELERQFQHAMRHRLRARRAARAAGELEALAGLGPLAAAASRPRRVGLERGVRAAWLAAAALLGASLLARGTRSWLSGAGDLALIALTCAWFYLDTRERVPPPPGDPPAAAADVNPGAGATPR